MTVHRVWLGGSGLHVSRLAFGTAFMGPQSDRMSPQAGASLLLQALAQGVSFWDTADDYGTHVHVARALRQVPRERVVQCCVRQNCARVHAREQPMLARGGVVAPSGGWPVSHKSRLPERGPCRQRNTPAAARHWSS